jgi:hypothetical protein
MERWGKVKANKPKWNFSFCSLRFNFLEPMCVRHGNLDSKSFMKSVGKNVFLLPALIAGLGLIPAAPAQAQYTFGPQVQSTNTASITYNFGTGMFQYTDTNNVSADSAGLPLAGNAAAEITTTNAWTASFTPNLTARSMPGGGAYVEMSLAIIIDNNLSNAVYISAAQLNYSGAGGGNFYGTEWYFEAFRNGANLPTTRQGVAFYNDGVCYITPTGSTNGSPTTESIAAVTAALSLTCNPATGILTGGFTGAGPIGSISLTNWGSNPSLTLAVIGGSGYGINVPAGTDTASNFFAGVSAPQLTLMHSGANVILTWPTNATGFTLQSTTNLVSPTGWTTVSPTPVIVSTNNVVTNSITGAQQFFRLQED